MPRFDGLRIAFDFVISKDDDLPLQIRFRVDTGGIYVVDYVRGGLLSTNVRDSTQSFCENNITVQMLSTTFDPENRLVAAELERRWEMALRDLEQAERSVQTPTPASRPRLRPELEAAFRAIGQNLPTLWEQTVLSTEQKKALLRCLLDKVVLHREPRDQIQVRIVWKGGEVTTMTVPIAVGSLAELSGAVEMEQLIVEWSQAGQLDEEMAEQLHERGFRSPMGTTLLPSTVKAIRLRHKIWQKRSQSHPRHMAGYLTVPELATAVGTTRHWIYDRIHNGTIVTSRDTKTQLYLFPDTPATRTQLEQLKHGTLQQLRFSQEYPDE